MRPRFLGVEATRQMLGIGRTRVYQLIGEGLLTAVKLGRRTLITTQSIERFCDELQEGR